MASTIDANILQPSPKPPTSTFKRVPLIFPGISFLIRSIPYLSLPYFLPFCGIAYAQKSLSVKISIPLQALLYISALPLAISVRVVWKHIQDYWNAAALGAVHAPVLKGNFPGNIDPLIDAIFSKSRLRSRYLGDTIGKAFDKMGPFLNRRILWIDWFITCEPEHLKVMLATNFNTFEKGEEFRGAFQDFLGSGIVNSDGDMWKFHRSMIRPFFTRDKMIQFEIFKQTAAKAISAMSDRLRAGYAVDIQDLASRYTFDSTTKFLFGMEIDELSESLPYPYFVEASDDKLMSNGKSSNDSSSRKFSRAFLEAQKAVTPRLSQGALWPISEITKNFAVEPMKFVDKYLYEVLEKSVKTNSELECIDEENQTLLDQLSKQTNDREIWKDEIVNLFIAARDTTSALITFIMYKLATRPDIMSRLRAEILERIGSERAPTLDDLKEMRYLKAVVNETLRMYPPNAFNVRQASRPTTLPPLVPGEKPFYIAPNQKIMYSVFFMHRRKDLWGPDAWEFDPDRFLDERLHKYLTPNPFIFLPFNAGPRICVGQQFALNESSFFIVCLLQQFQHIELDLESIHPSSRVPAHFADSDNDSPIAKEKVWIKSHLTVYAEGGLWVKMR